MARFEVTQKMEEWSLWAMWWLLVGGATLWLLVGSVGYWVKHGWLPEDASGWVQAIGSIVAIAVAVIVPIHLRVRERADRVSEKHEQDLARSEQLIALCSEGISVIGSFDAEAAFADYDINNALRRAVLSDLLDRLNEAQKTELNAERMGVGMQLRFCIHDWMKYFGGDEVTDLGRLHDRVNRFAPRLEGIKISAQNILQAQRGLPLIDLPAPPGPPEGDIPF
ncbi:hypothetical protein N7333_13010 [Pseudomonas sp. GD04158]|uniref:hypothetical protein n=1 Tax=Pseudomonas sp. GD04158 TaxID=2975439 RepID=UPI00244C1C27|nr:hypothetical protein [Pseudomonas sp. GD04158]MDH0097494.1 hypothetical protein [Pseudomonas sp. GD04158]